MSVLRDKVNSGLNQLKGPMGKFWGMIDLYLEARDLTAGIAHH
jgi:hypothetical protein